MGDLTWRKSSYSTTQQNCVELADGAVRDSKNPAGPALSVNLTALVTAIKAGHLVTLRLRSQLTDDAA